MQTIPVTMRKARSGELFAVARRAAIQEAYAEVELRQFQEPEDAERLAEILSLIRSQTQDDTAGDRPERFGHGGRVKVLPHDPEALEQFAYERDALGRQSGRRGRLIREKTEREQWEDEMLRGGLEPILAGLTIAQRDAIRLTWNDGKTRREVADALGIFANAVQKRLTAAYTHIRSEIARLLEDEEPSYRAVRRFLQKQGVDRSAAGRESRLPAGSQAPTLSPRMARLLEQSDSVIQILAKHDCSAMCHTAQSRVAARTSSVRLIPLGGAN